MFHWTLKKLKSWYLKSFHDSCIKKIQELELDNSELNKKYISLLEKSKEIKKQNILIINELRRLKRKELTDKKPKDSVFDNNKINYTILDNLQEINQVISKINIEKEKDKE